MAKKGKKKDKLPKEIAGVKVPKELRKTGEQLLKIAKDPTAREVALAALGAALAARKDARQAAKQAVADVGDAAEETGKRANWVGTAIAAAAAEAGRAFLDAYTGAEPKKASADDGVTAKAAPRKADSAPSKVAH